VGIAKLSAGQDLTLIERYVNGADDWFHVMYGETTGWVSAEFLRFAPSVAERIAVITEIPDPNPALVGTVREQNINLRGGPGTAYTKLGTLHADVQVDLVGRYEDWFQVRTSTGDTGWIAGEFVGASAFVARRVPRVSDIPALPQRQQPQRNEGTAATPASAPAVAAVPPLPPAGASGVADFGLQFVGTPYVWGGASPGGFDCSGFTKYVYGQYGIGLPHSAEGQFSSAYGAIISDPSALAPGDLVFFVNTYKPGISHVGIYIGGGNVVQAMSPALGLGVANMYGPYWAERYYAGLRPY
jgi:cell wall-associated NlpC family hydrolase